MSTGKGGNDDNHNIKGGKIEIMERPFRSICILKLVGGPPFLGKRRMAVRRVRERRWHGFGSFLRRNYPRKRGRENNSRGKQTSGERD